MLDKAVKITGLLVTVITLWEKAMSHREYLLLAFTSVWEELCRDPVNTVRWSFLFIWAPWLVISLLREQRRKQAEQQRQERERENQERNQKLKVRFEDVRRVAHVETRLAQLYEHLGLQHDLEEFPDFPDPNK